MALNNVAIKFGDEYFCFGMTFFLSKLFRTFFFKICLSKFFFHVFFKIFFPKFFPKFWELTFFLEIFFPTYFQIFFLKGFTLDASTFTETFDFDFDFDLDLDLDVDLDFDFDDYIFSESAIFN